MTSYDNILQANADDECRAWIRKLLDAKEEVVSFVDTKLHGNGAGQYLGFVKGSFNLSFHIGFGDHRPSALIRFPKPGHTYSVWRTEKLENEMRIIEYLRQHTTMPLPCIRCWGSAEESPANLGPFIIMDFIEGIKLSTLLKQPPEDEDAEIVLDPAADTSTLDIIYEQLADYIHQISQLEFPLIGAISMDALEDWTVTRRPLTYDMNELVTGTGYPADQLPTAPFNTASDFFESIARQRLLHLEAQRNIAKDESNVIRRFTARHLFKQLIPRYTIDDAGPFRLFCDDMRPSNILIDPSTFRISAILDFEFTNSMPAQFVYDPPWWLLLRGPDVWIDRDNLDEFIARYVPRMEQFLRALEKVEQKSMKNGDKNMTTSLSTRMRESWASGRFWFNYAARTCLDMDEVYWHVLHDKCFPDNSSHIDEATMKGLDPLIERKMEHLRAYEEEYAARFPDP